MRSSRHRHPLRSAFTALLAGSALSVLAAVVAPAALANGHATQGAKKSTTAHGANAHSSASSGKAHDHQTEGTNGTSGDPSQPQPPSNADQNSGGANGQCPGGPYCSTRDGSASGNGNGNGNATGKPCAGCVGKADNKNPPGQYPDGSDANAGYECDRNHGIGRTNPAHTGCIPGSGTDCTATPTAPECLPGGGTDCTATPTAPECLPGGGTECTPTEANNFCSDVIGNHHQRTPTASPPTVLGKRVVRTPQTLPFTGADIALLLAIGIAGLAGGALLTVVSRRKGARA